MFTVSMVRLLKGCPLACVFALMIAQQDRLGAQGAEWLERATGYTDKPVSQALLFLQEQGVISRNGRYLWQLCGEFVQLPLGRVQLLDGLEAKGVGNIPTHPSSSSSRYIDSNLSESTTTSQTLSAAESEKFRLDEGVLAALDVAKIREPARSRLAGLEWVTVELIEYHMRTAEKPGLAIYRIKNNWPILEGDNLATRNEYVSGQFADFIQH